MVSLLSALSIVPELYFDPRNLIVLSAILISYIIGMIDTYFRPFSDSMRKDASTNSFYNIIMLAIFVFNPLFTILAFRENRLLIANTLYLGTMCFCPFLASLF